MMNADFWVIAASISTVVSTIAVVIAIPFAIIQIRQATRSRYLEALAKVFDEFHSEDFFQDRRFVYSHKPFTWDSCTLEERVRIERLVNAYNQMAFLVEKGMIAKPLILELWSGALLASWQKLDAYIRARRAATGFSDWAIQFERLAAQSEEYRTKILGEESTTYRVEYPTDQSS